MKALKTVNLRFWLPALLSLFFALWLTFFVFLQQRNMETQLEQRTLENLNERLAASQRQIENLLRNHQDTLAYNELTSLAFLEGMQELSLLDHNGRIVHSTTKEWKERNAKEVHPYFNQELFLSSQSSQRQLLRLSGDRLHIYGYQPIRFPTAANKIRASHTGVILLDYDLGGAKAHIWKTLLKDSLAIWTIAAIMMVLVQLAISQWVSRPLTHLTTIIRRFKSGERDVHVNIRGEGELAALGNAWNEMHDALASTVSQLKESQERLAVTLLSIGDAVIATDNEGTVTLLNSVAEKLTGWQQASAAGKPLQEIFHIINAHTREPAQNPVKRVLVSGKIVGLANDTLLISRDGHEYQIADSAAPIKKENGEVCGVVLVFRDVTEEYALQAALQKHQEHLSLSQTYGEIGTWEADLVDSNQYWSPTVYQLLGFPEVKNPTWEDFLHVVIEEDRQKLIDATHKHLHQGEKYDVEYRIATQEGEVRWMRSAGRAEFTQDGTPIRMRGIVQDITARKLASTQLELASKVFAHSSEGFLITDADAKIIMVNQAFTNITGYSEEDALGKNPRFLGSGHHTKAFYDEMWTRLMQQGTWQGEIWNRRKDGSLFPEWLSMNNVVDKNGTITNFIGIFNDITLYKEAEAHIQRLAHFDSLTTLPNRTLFKEQIEQAIGNARANNQLLTLLFLDLDRFKNINDSLGHRVGDELLIEIGKRLKASVRGEDSVSRLGGDEFMILLVNTDAGGAAHVAKKILEVVAKPFAIEGYDLTVTPSIGIAMFPHDGTDFDTLYKAADAAMYRAKANFRNNFCFYTPEMQVRSAKTLQLENALRRAIELDQLRLHYQPQICLRTGAITGAEALIRWQHPEFGLVPPLEFIPIAEDSGQILAIGEWALRTAIRQMKTWVDKGLPFASIAVNLSSIQFRYTLLPELVSEILEGEGLPPENLELEITESASMDDPAAAIATIEKLHRCGIKIAIDDFGTGYSSLSYLKQLQVHKIKIDRSFVNDITRDNDDAAIVSAIISMAKNLGIKTIAEGVETSEQVAFLQEKNCDEVQGYFFSKPLPAGDFETFARENLKAFQDTK